MKNFIKGIIKRFLPKNLYNDLTPYFVHLPKAVLANFVFGFPSKKIKIIGVAGTKGKSTTAYLISQLLEALGQKTALISTTSVKIGEEEKLNPYKMTSVGAWDLQAFLKEAVLKGCDFAILETSSHALKQFRTWGVDFNLAVLTNMMPDHQEYHKSIEDYSLSHLKMISQKTRALVLNYDDPNLRPFRELVVRKIGFGFDQQADLLMKNFDISDSGSWLEVFWEKNQVRFVTKFLGKFNLYNLAAALAAVYALGFDIKKLVGKTESLKPAPGRVEKIVNNKGFEVLVDYAHSPDSFENLLSALRPYVKGRLIAVTGACGERDASKRPEMGKILANYCDFCVITNDDPYGEDEEKIAKELIAGLVESGKFKENQNWWKVLDRRQAIKKGFVLAQKNDAVVIMGKGAEQWQVFKDKKIPWDDRKVAREELEKK